MEKSKTSNSQEKASSCAAAVSPLKLLAGVGGDESDHETRNIRARQILDSMRTAKPLGDFAVTVSDIQTHMARRCLCGSVKFNLLRNGKIECVGCSREQEGIAWGDED